MSNSNDLMDCSLQASLSMEFSRAEFWGGLPFPFPGGFPDPEIEPASPELAAGFFTTVHLKLAQHCKSITLQCILKNGNKMFIILY